MRLGGGGGGGCYYLAIPLYEFSKFLKNILVELICQSILFCGREIFAVFMVRPLAANIGHVIFFCLPLKWKCCLPES